MHRHRDLYDLLQSLDVSSAMIYTSPQTWHQWDVQAWNKKLLWFCFVADADASPDQGLRASEEDLLELTGDHQNNPQTMAENRSK